MKEYKAPQTRIKIVEQGGEVKYYPQYKIVIIPKVWEEWQPIYNNIEACGFATSLNQAKDRIYIFLKRQETYHYEKLEKDKVKRAKINVSYLDYP